MLLCAHCYADMTKKARKCPECGHVPSDADVFKTRYGAEELLKLGLSQKLVDFVMKEPRKGIFEYSCEEKYGGWIAHIPEDVSAVYPLWSANGDLTVAWIRKGIREFVETFHDDPAFTVLAKTEQGLLAELFKTVMERLDWDTDADTARSEKKLRAEAARLGFEHIETFLQQYARSGTDPNGYERQIKNLMAQIDQREQR